MKLASASVLVTGGASGLGLATASRLHELGARVTVADLHLPSEEVAAGFGGEIAFVQADVTDEQALQHALDVAEEKGALRALVHTAGRGGDRLRILDKNGDPSPLASFEDVLRTNLVGTYNVLRLAAARIGRADLDDDGERGAIVLTASVAAFDGQIGQTSYAASKAGVHGMTLVAARDLASRAIRINTIAPGVFDTPMLGRFGQDIRTALENSVPHPKRLGRAGDYAHLAVALLENAYMNGETIRLDGSIRMGPR